MHVCIFCLTLQHISSICHISCRKIINLQPYAAKIDYICPIGTFSSDARLCFGATMFSRNPFAEGHSPMLQVSPPLPQCNSFSPYFSLPWLPSPVLRIEHPIIVVHWCVWSLHYATNWNFWKKDGMKAYYSQSIFNAELNAVFRFSLARQVFE